MAHLTASAGAMPWTALAYMSQGNGERERHGEEALGVARRLSHQSKSLVEIGIVWNPDRLAGG